MLTQFLKCSAVLLLIALTLAGYATQSASGEQSASPSLATATLTLTLTPTPDAAALLDGYCMRWRNAADFVWWIEQGGILRGQYQSAGFYSDLLDGEFNAETAPFTGTRQGDWIVFDFGWASSVTLIGVLKIDENGDDYLLLYRPDRDTGTIASYAYWPCTAADFNKQVENVNWTRDLIIGATQWASLSDEAKNATQTQWAVDALATATAVQQIAAPTQTAASEIPTTRHPAPPVSNGG